LGTPVKHRAAYNFAVLEDLLGLRAESNDPPDNERNSSFVLGMAAQAAKRPENGDQSAL
jgi:hypothetical protein